MKHVLFLTWKDIKHPKKGGAEVVMYEYAKRLVKDGHKVTWFSSGFKNAKENENIDGIEIIRKYNINTIYFFTWKWYKNFIKNNQVDIIIDEAGGIPLLSPLYEKNIPIYFFIHHIGEEEYEKAFFFPLNKIFKKFVYWTFSLYKNYPTITVSYSTKNELEKKIEFKDIFVIENATNIVPLKKINFENKKNEIIFLGRLTTMKRVDHAILAFQEFYKKNNDFILNIIGNKQDKEYFLKLEKSVKDNNLEKTVNFINYSKENVEKYLSHAKAMLVTSTKEGFGLIVLEGNAYGLPVFSYDVPGLRDSTKNEINGYLIEDGNYKKMGKKLDEIINDKEKYFKISHSSLEYIKNIGGWDEKYKEFKKIIKL